MSTDAPEQQGSTQPAATLRHPLRWLAQHRRLAMLAAGGGILLAGSVAAVAVLLATRKPPEKLITLAETLGARLPRLCRGAAAGGNHAASGQSIHGGLGRPGLRLGRGGRARRGPGRGEDPGRRLPGRRPLSGRSRQPRLSAGARGGRVVLVGQEPDALRSLCGQPRRSFSRP